jgi:hypothetical protein
MTLDLKSGKSIEDKKKASESSPSIFTRKNLLLLIKS